MVNKILILFICCFAISSDVLGSCPQLYPYQSSIGGKSGYIDAKGEIIVEPKYFYAEEMAEGLARVEVTGNGRHPKYGFIDGCGNLVIQPTFYDAFSFSEGLAAVLTEKGWGFIDKSGKIKIELGVWDSSTIPPLSSFSSGFALVYFSKGVSFIDKNGKRAFGGTFDDASQFYNGVAVVERNKKFAVINTSGNYVLMPQNRKIIISSDGVTSMKGKNNIWTYYSNKGKKLFSSRSELNFSEGLASFENNGKYGYLRLDGKISIQPLYEFAGDFQKGIAVISIGENQYGIINNKGKIIIPAVYRNISIIDKNVVVITSSNKSCFTTLSGRTFGCKTFKP